MLLAIAVAAMGMLVLALARDPHHEGARRRVQQWLLDPTDSPLLAWRQNDTLPELHVELRTSPPIEDIAVLEAERAVYAETVFTFSQPRFHAGTTVTVKPDRPRLVLSVLVGTAGVRAELPSRNGGLAHFEAPLPAWWTLLPLAIVLVLAAAGLRPWLALAAGTIAGLGVHAVFATIGDLPRLVPAARGDPRLLGPFAILCGAAALLPHLRFSLVGTALFASLFPLSTWNVAAGAAADLPAILHSWPWRFVALATLVLAVARVRRVTTPSTIPPPAPQPLRWLATTFATVGLGLTLTQVCSDLGALAFVQTAAVVPTVLAPAALLALATAVAAGARSGLLALVLLLPPVLTPTTGDASPAWIAAVGDGAFTGELLAAAQARALRPFLLVALLGAAALHTVLAAS